MYDNLLDGSDIDISKDMVVGLFPGKYKQVCDEDKSLKSLETTRIWGKSKKNKDTWESYWEKTHDKFGRSEVKPGDGWY